MKRKTILFLIVIVTHISIALSAQDTPVSDHVILVSIDGFRPDFYLQEKWPAPNLKRMAREGVQVKGARGVFPSVTYPSHTTLITGALPATHGIYYKAHSSRVAVPANGTGKQA